MSTVFDFPFIKDFISAFPVATLIDIQPAVENIVEIGGFPVSRGIELGDGGHLFVIVEGTGGELRRPKDFVPTQFSEFQSHSYTYSKSFFQEPVSKVSLYILTEWRQAVPYLSSVNGSSK